MLREKADLMESNVADFKNKATSSELFFKTRIIFVIWLLTKFALLVVMLYVNGH